MLVPIERDTIVVWISKTVIDIEDTLFPLTSAAYAQACVHDRGSLQHR